MFLYSSGPVTTKCIWTVKREFSEHSGRFISGLVLIRESDVSMTKEQLKEVRENRSRSRSAHRSAFRSIS